MGSIKQINIKNRTYCGFGDIVNIKYFDSHLLKIHKNSSKKIDSVNPSYFIIGEVDGYIEEKNGNKYLIFAFTDENKEVLTKYTELWNRAKDLIEKINNKPGKYGKDLMKT